VTPPLPLPLSLSTSQARRLALAAQGFTDPRPAGRIDRRHLRRVLGRIGVLQIDSVNVLVRSQELPLFARLGPHPRTLIADATDAGELFEYWVHEASHVPTEHYHLHRWRMAEEHRWKGVRQFEDRRPGFLAEVERFVRDHGPVVASDLRQRSGPKGTWWDWDDGKIALEYLFHTGAVSARRRRSDFARIYDLTERIVPAEVLARPAPPEREARRELLELAARSMGVATLADLADYHRQKITPCRSLVNELVEAGRLLPAAVEGWAQPAFVHADARVPRRTHARALLSPFDSLVWNRDRTERLFGFRYRIEIYVPAALRRYGYYVLPFLLGEELVARVDVKADRARRVLMVRSAWGEPGIDTGRVVPELADELAMMATWLDLESVEVLETGDLSPALAAATRPPRRGPTATPTDVGAAPTAVSG
jgi:uncharacterized protein